MYYLSLKNICYRFLFLLPDPEEGMLPLLKRLFGVKVHDCFLSCLAFALLYNFSRFRLFCAMSGLTVPIACGLKYFTCSGSCRC